MPIDPDQPSVVLEALHAADTVDARAIDVTADGDVLVLRGSVATFEEATAAANVAEAHAEAVRNELRVDVNLREGGGGEPDELVENLQDSLEENVPWDPPTESVEVPTRAEARGTAGSITHDTGGADMVTDAAAAPTEKSLSDLSPEELARAAHPQSRDEETTE